ncbi:MAG TPA: EamA family transporter [Pseudolabrys sp.]|nr:EamA family transporter [Pseudolabrys sp.]
MPTTQASNLAPARRAAGTGAAGSARILVLLLAFAWGTMWIATAIGLREVPPWSLRFASASIGAAVLFTAAWLTGHDMRLPRGERRHVFVAGFCNVFAFNMFAVFAQLTGATSRVIIVTYSMPIWAALLSRLMLGERLTPVRTLALALCVAGLGTLLWPQFEIGVPVSIFLALGCAVCWAFATVYIKWAKVTVEPITNAAWQLLFGALLLTIGMLIFEHYPRLWPLDTTAILAVIYMGLLGVGFAHFLWWSIVGKLPATTASIGALLVPVIGVTCSALILGERPTWQDIIGFALIFAAAACVLLRPEIQHTEKPE